MNNVIKVEGKIIGEGQPTFLVAEIGSNHGLDKSIVKNMVDVSAKAGFDAVKFQIYAAEEVFSKHEMTTDVKLDYLYGVRPWWEVARDIILMPRSWFGEMFDYVRSKGMIPFSAIHRVEDVEFLDQFGLPIIKIASIDLHYHHFLSQVAKYKKPMLISTGMAYLSEIDETMRLLKEENCKDIILLHCISQYPPIPSEVNLRNITMLREAFDAPVGFSDHSTGITTSIGAVALNANVIEKHITLDKTTKGPDHSFAIEPDEMYALVKAVREIEAAMGKSYRVLSERDLAARKMIRRSIVARDHIKKGDPITFKKIKFARPGSGIGTNEFKYIEGRRAARDIAAETIIEWNMIS